MIPTGTPAGEIIKAYLDMSGSKLRNDTFDCECSDPRGCRTGIDLDGCRTIQSKESDDANN